MDKLTAIRIKMPNGSYSDQILISTLAENVRYDSTNSVKDILDLLDVRIGAIAALPNGSTTGDAELMDLRIGANGKNDYSNAGNAVRGNINKLKQLILIQSSQPNEISAFDNTTSWNKLWINNDTSEEIEIPTKDEFDIVLNSLMPVAVLTWQSGDFDVYGANHSNGNSIRTTDFVPDNIIGVMCSSNYKFCIWAWDKETGDHIGHLKEDGEFGQTSSYGFKKSFAFDRTLGYKYKITFYNDNSTTSIATSAGQNCITYRDNTDTTLSMVGVAADAKATGDRIANLKSAYTGLTDNLFVFQDGTWNGVTVKRQSDGGLKITGTCTGSVNIKVNITPFYGDYSLVVESDVSVPAGSVYVYLRNSSSVAINNIAYSGTRMATNAIANQNNPIAMVDLNFINSKTYNYTLYIQLLNVLYYRDFISPYTAVDRIARRIAQDLTSYVTPQMYGAIGDGVADDSTPIQNAMNSGKDVYFPSGTYRITRTITIPSTMYQHKIYADGDINRHNAVIIVETLPAFSNLGAGYKISGLAFSANNFPDLAGANPESKPYISCTAQLNDNLDIIIENCYFEKNYCMIYIKGRNMYIKNNLFYDMGNTGYCIFLDYPETADGESDTNINGFKNNYSGFRGFLIEGNRCHYTRNWLINTTAAKCRNIKGMVIRNNYLEGAFCVIGYLNNAIVENNITFQASHHDWTDDRHDACFYLYEMINTTIDGYHCSGSDEYTNMDENVIPEAMYSMFLYSRGACINCKITNVFVSNFLNSAFAFAGGTTSLRLDANIRKTRATLSNNIIGFVSGLYNSIIDIAVNDVTESPEEGTYIVDWYPRSDANDNYIRVTANYDCIKYPEV